MKEHFLSYEQSLAVKELGFDEPCVAYYHTDKSICYTGMINQNTNAFWNGKFTSAPLKSQFFKWVREKYLLIGYASTGFCPFKDEPKSKSGYRGFIKGVDIRRLSSSDKFFKEIETTCFKTYEEAEDACIDKIIELLKNKHESKTRIQV